MTELKVNYFGGNPTSVGKSALLLALANTREEESEIKTYLKTKYGYETFVIEIGGILKDINNRVVKSVLNAALNAGVIEKKTAHVHPLIHATVEAERGMMLQVPYESSFRMKVAVVVGQEWLAVAMFGESALHILSAHERVGLGVMHI